MNKRTVIVRVFYYLLFKKDETAVLTVANLAYSVLLILSFGSLYKVSFFARSLVKIEQFSKAS